MKTFALLRFQENTHNNIAETHAWKETVRLKFQENSYGKTILQRHNRKIFWENICSTEIPGKHLQANSFVKTLQEDILERRVAGEIPGKHVQQHGRNTRLQRNCPSEIPGMGKQFCKDTAGRYFLKSLLY